MKASYAITGAVFILALAGLVVFLTGGGYGAPSADAGASAASSTVADFGKVLQQVSILSSNASSAIAEVYAPYVMPTLLQEWEADPKSAPGRVASSPWPDHIRIISVMPQGSGYIVQGALVFMTSAQVAQGGEQSEVPVIALVVPEGSGWGIAAFSSAATSTGQ